RQGGDVFKSGSADVNPSYVATLDRIAAALNGVKGRVMVVGHTDDQPIKSSRAGWDRGEEFAEVPADNASGSLPAPGGSLRRSSSRPRPARPPPGSPGTGSCAAGRPRGSQATGRSGRRRRSGSGASKSTSLPPYYALQANGLTPQIAGSVEKGRELRSDPAEAFLEELLLAAKPDAEMPLDADVDARDDERALVL